MNLLDRYVIRAVLGGVFVVLGVLLTLGALFLFANQQDDIGQGTYTALDAFWFVLLNIPQQVYEMMPIAVLIGALLGLGTLSRGSELTVMRAAGLSVWRIYRFSGHGRPDAGAGSPWCAANSSRRRCRPWPSSRSCWPSFPPSPSPAVAWPVGARRRPAHQRVAAVRRRRVRRHADLRAHARSRAEIRGHRHHRHRAAGRQLEALALRQHHVRRRAHRIASIRTAGIFSRRSAEISWR